MVGQNIGKYRVLDRIGRGGMGTVYRAVDETLHRDVAIKVLNAELNDPEIARRFRAEAITVARLSHPGIATIYELFQHEGQWLMVMEFVRGETLERLVERSGPLPAQRTAELCMQTLAALAHAHSMGVVHRDLKPANIMITEAGAIKVMDFGIARVSGTEHLTSAGFMMGTPAYMAPEQVVGKEIDARADLYAIGVVFYRLTAGKLPFKGDTPFAMAQSQVNDPPMPITEFRTDLPEWVEQVVSRALAKNPEERFQSAIEFHEAFARCLEGQPMPAPYSSSAPTEILRTPSRALPTGSISKPATPPSMPPLTGKAGDPTPLAQPASASPLELEPTVLAPKPSAAPAAPVAAVPVSETAQVGSPLAQGPTAAMPTATVPAGPTPADVGIVGRALDVDVPKAAAPSVPKVQPAAGKSGSSMLVIGAVVIVLVGGAIAWFVMRGTPAAPSSEPAPVAVDAPTPPEPTPAEPAPAELTPTVPPPVAAATPQSGAPAPAAGTPASAAKPAAPAARSGAAGRSSTAAAPVPAPAPETPLSIADVKLFVVTERNKTSDQDVTLNFADGTVTAVAKRGGAVLASMPYAAATHVTYTKARDPKWDASAPGPPANLDVGGMLRTSKHWIVLQASDRYMILRLEDANWRRAYEAVRARTGLTISLPTSTDKP